MVDDGQYPLGVLFNFCVHFFYYTNEAVSSNCTKKDLRTLDGDINILECHLIIWQMKQVS